MEGIQFLREAKAPLIQAMLFVKWIILQSGRLRLWTNWLVSSHSLRTSGIVLSIYWFFSASDRKCISEDGLGRLVILWTHNGLLFFNDRCCWRVPNLANFSTFSYNCGSHCPVEHALLESVNDEQMVFIYARNGVFSLIEALRWLCARWN